MGPSQLKEFNPIIVNPVLNAQTITSSDLSMLAKIYKGIREPSQFTESERYTVLFDVWSGLSNGEDIGLAAIAALSYQLTYRSDDRAASYLIDCVKNSLGKDFEFKFITQSIGFETMTRLAMLDKDIAKQFIQSFAHDIDANSAEWLYVISAIKRPYGDINDDYGQLHAPAKGTDDYRLCHGIIQILVLHDALEELNILLREELSNDIEESRQEVLESIVSNLRNRAFVRGLHAWSESVIPPKSGFFEPALKSLSTVATNELLACYEFMLLQKVADEALLPKVKDILEPICQTYGYETVQLAIKHLLNNTGSTKEVKALEQALIDDIKSLKPEYLCYVMTRLMVYDHPIPDDFEISQPKEEKDIQGCNRIIDIAHSSPTLWEHVRKAVAELSNPQELYKGLIFAGSYFTTVANALSEVANDEARFWLYLAITTHSEQEVYRLLNTQNEFVDTTAIRNQHVIDANTTLIRLAKSSPILKEMISRALLQKADMTSEYEKTVSKLPIYVSQYIREKLTALTPDSKIWLYQAITLNLRSTTAIPVAEKKVIPPTGHQEKMVRSILDAIHYNSQLRSEFKKLLEQTIDSKALLHIDSIRQNYIKLSLKRLNPDEIRWLYANSLSLNVSETVEAYFGKSFKIRPEIKSVMAKTLFVASQDYHLIQFMQNELLALNPNLPEEVIQSVYELGPLAMWEQDASEIACQCASHESIARSMLPLLLAKLEQFDSIWLSQCLSTSDIDFSKHPVLSNPILQMLGHSLDETPAAVMPLIFISLKYPTLRKEILGKLVKDYHGEPLPEIKSIKLDGLPLNDNGFALLANAMAQNTYPLEQLSLRGTQITGKHLELLEPILANAPLEIFNVDQELLIDGGARRLDLLAQDNERIIPLLISTMINSMTDPLGWAYLKIKSDIKSIVEELNISSSKGQELIAASQGTTAFHFQSHPQLPLIQLLAKYLDTHVPAQFKASLFSSGRIPEELVQIQKVLLGLSSDCPELLLDVLEDLHISTPELITKSFKECLTSGRLQLVDIQDEAFASIVNDQEGGTHLLSTGIIAAMLNALIPSHKEQVGLIFGLPQEEIRSFDSVDVSNYQFPDFIQRMIALSVAKSQSNERVLLSKATFADGFKELCECELSPCLHTLDISQTQINVDNFNDILNALGKMPQLSTLNISACEFDSDETFDQFFDGLASLKLERLVYQGNKDAQIKLSKHKMEKVSEYLAHPSCRLESIDLSNQSPNPIALERCLKELQNNKQLKEVILDNVVSSPRTFKLILALIKQNHYINKISLNGHTQGLKGLEMLYESIKDHPSLYELRAHPAGYEDKGGLEDGLGTVLLLEEKINLELLKKLVEDINLEDLHETSTPNPLRFSAPANSQHSYVKDVTKELDQLKLKQSM